MVNPTVSQAFILILKEVDAREPVSFTVMNDVLPMCERLVGSHMKRLQTRGYLAYNVGMYSVTPEGRALLEEYSGE